MTDAPTIQDDAALEDNAVTIEEARETIAGHFRENPCWQPPLHPTRFERQERIHFSRTQVMEMVNTVNKVVELLEKFPTLASEKFRVALDPIFLAAGFFECFNNLTLDLSFVPLTFFIWSNLDVAFLNRIYKLCPSAITQKQGDFPSLLQLACRLSLVSDQTLVWLLPKFSPASYLVKDCVCTRWGATACTPFFRLLRTREQSGCEIVSLDVIKALLNKFSSSQAQTLCGELFLCLIKKDAPVGILEYLTDNLPQEGCDSLSLGGMSRLLIGYENIIEKVLPRLKTLNCRFNDDTVEVGVSIIDCIVKGGALLESVSLTLSVVSFPDGMVQIIKDYLASKPAQTELDLSLKSMPGPIEEILPSVLDGLLANPIRGSLINTLDIDHHPITGEGAQLQFMARMLPYVRHLKVRGAFEIKSLGTFFRNLQNNKSVESLELQGKILDNEHIDGLPSLILDSVCDKNTTLKKISVKMYGLPIDGEPFEQIVAFSDMPASDRKHHRYVDFECSKKIQYACWVNEHGIRRLGSKRTTRGDLVLIIMEVKTARAKAETLAFKRSTRLLKKLYSYHSADNVKGIFFTLLSGINKWSWIADLEAHRADTLSILYGLLLESPDRWCNDQPVHPRKRKRMEPET